MLSKAKRYAQPTIEAPDGTVVQDTTDIIDFVEAREAIASVYPSSAKQRLVSLLFELYGDEGLLKAAMHYRWNYPVENRQWIIEEFSCFCDPTLDISVREQAEAIAQTMESDVVGKLGVNQYSATAIESSYEEFLDLFNQHCRCYPYLLGGRPSIGDFGLIAPLYAHLGRDPYPSKLMKQRAPYVYRWVERMNAADPGMAEFPKMEQQFLASDEIPETLLPILSLIARDYMPEIQSLLLFMAQWLENHPNVAPGLPVVEGGAVAMGTGGALGEHRFALRGVEISQSVRHYSQWMFQRVIDYYSSLNPETRQQLDAFIEPTGLLPFLQLTIPRRIERVDNIEVFA